MIRYFGTLLLCYLIYNVYISEILAHPSTSTTVATTYDTKFDNVDLDEILKQDRLLTNYVKCLEGKGPCTPDGKMLKETLPDAVETNCSKCSERQKYGSDKVTRYLIDNRPDDWDRLEKIYDKGGKYRKEYLAEKAAKNAQEKNESA